MTIDERQHHILMSEMQKFDETEVKSVNGDKLNYAQKPTIE
jgi:hypothetical protein